MKNRKYVFAIGAVESGAFAGLNAGGWDYLYADTPEAAWYLAKKQWDYRFPLSDFRAAIACAEAKQFPFPEGAPARNGNFVQAKLYW